MGKKFFIGVFSSANTWMGGISEATTSPRGVSYTTTNNIREVKEFDEEYLAFAEVLIKLLKDENGDLRIVWLPE